MQITAKLIQFLPVQTGIGKNGEWKKQDMIVETSEQYPKKICITVWGDKIDGLLLQPSDDLKIDFDIESREYSGKWYTDIKAWKVEKLSNLENLPSTVDDINETMEDEGLPF